MVTAAEPTAAKKPERKRYAFQWRAFVALLLFGVTLWLLVSGLVLYVAPSGRVAKTVEWRFLWLDKDQWEALHTMTGFAFLALFYYHVVYNWRSILAYMRRKAKQAVQIRREFVWASLITALMLVGSVYNLAPVRAVMDFGETMNDFWEWWGTRQGYYVVGEDEAHVEEEASGETEETTTIVKTGYGKLTVQDLAEQEGVELDVALSRLAGYDVTAAPDDNLLTLSGRSGYTPGELAAIVRGEDPEDAGE
ncbi:DUF4405 domain-containing protein [Oceanithermus sp.]|uniref:DUF4405 domain-containing protein n=1 Tax=Oceanithermus sp. TaxID=2268145 RepID=UPI0025E88D28|nr:DUF4405 domain-containing protein [Oceanithermus sp.]